MQVTVVDSLVNASPESLNRVANLTGHGDKLHFFELDIRDKDNLRRLFSAMGVNSPVGGIHACIHFAGLKVTTSTF